MARQELTGGDADPSAALRVALQEDTLPATGTIVVCWRGRIVDLGDDEPGGWRSNTTRGPAAEMAAAAAAIRDGNWEVAAERFSETLMAWYGCPGGFTVGEYRELALSW